MILKFIVTGLHLSLPNDERGKSEQSVYMNLQRAPDGKLEDWGHPSVSLKLKPEDRERFKLGEVLTFQIVTDSFVRNLAKDYERVEPPPMQAINMATGEVTTVDPTTGAA
jgi:hypothetical protein